MSNPAKFSLFLSSWFPAYAMIGAIAWKEHRGVAYGAAGVTVVSLLAFLLVYKLIFQTAPRTLKVSEITRRDENMLMYIVAYLPPFFTFDFSNYGAIVAIALFYVVSAITYVKLDLYYLNPMFVFLSYRTYDLKSDGGVNFVAVIQGAPPEVGEPVQYRGGARDKILLIKPSSG